MRGAVYLNDKHFSKALIYHADKSAENRATMTVTAVRLENLRQLIEESGGPTKAAAKLEMEPSQLSQIAGRRPTRNIGNKLARKIEAAWQKPSGWMDRAHGPGASLRESVADYNVINAPEFRSSVPLISWVQAGHWRDVIDNLHPGDASKRIPTTARVSDHAFALEVVGDSMTNPGGSPSFPEGTVIILDPEREAQPGKFVVVRQKDDSEVTFKQLVRDGGTLYLKPLNPRYPILQMAPDAVICGVLVQAVMDF